LQVGNRFLDVGCGDGDLLGLAKSKFEVTYGVDLNVRSTSKLMPFIQCDIGSGLPFVDACFDSVTCVSVLQYLVNPSKVLKEIGRVLRIGGKLIIVEPNIGWLPYRIQLLFGKIPIAGYYHGTYHTFTKSSLCRLLASRGFEGLLCSGKFRAIRRFWLSLLSSDIVAKCRKTDQTTNDMLIEILYGKV
jgi:methionine biosynthesis protein MetW